MIKLNVWLNIDPEKVIRAGELVSSDPDSQGRLQGQFRYSPEYLNLLESFPLDPIHLPLSLETFNADRPYAGIHGVFEDSLPDDWGRRILARRYQLGRNHQRVPQLLAILGGHGMGALSYSRDDSTPVKKEGVDGQYLEDLQRLAAKFEKDATSIDGEMALLFQAGSSPGGARPKVLINDGEHAYLAKFASIKDQFNVVALESAAMELSRRAGVNAATTKCVPCGKGRVLLVERFDIDTATMRRNHVISMQTLLGAEGYYNLGYSDMATIIRRVSAHPIQDLHQLFKQLVFNVMIGNTDDHLKNFCMLYDGQAWRLSPAFDLVPNIGLNSEHVLRIGLANLIPNRDTLRAEAKKFGIKQRAKADELINIMLSVVSDWKMVFKEFEVPKRDMDVLGKDIENRLANLRP